MTNKERDSLTNHNKILTNLKLLNGNGKVLFEA